MTTALKTIILLAASFLSHSDHHHPLDHTHREEYSQTEETKPTISR